MTTAPLFFISHGSPMFAVDNGKASQNLASQSHLLDTVEAIVLISPHWLTMKYFVSTNEAPQTMHDFWGFPKHLNELTYEASGSSPLGHDILDLLQKNNFNAEEDKTRDWDHGVWVPLIHLYTKADKPVVQLSFNINSSIDELEEFGNVLKHLRRQNIAIICSGSLTHNLYEMSASHDEVDDRALQFQLWAREQVTSRNIEGLKQITTETEVFKKVHPTPEHFLPLIIAIAASDEQDEINVLSSPIQHRTISMESYVWVRNE